MKLGSRFATSLSIALLLSAALYVSVFSGRWHASNQLYWSAGPACRDGVLVSGRALAFVAGHTFPYQLLAYDDTFAEYPVFLDEIDGSEYGPIDPAKVGAQLGSGLLTKRGSPQAPWFFDDNGVTKVSLEQLVPNYALEIIDFDVEHSPGEVIAVYRQPGIRYVILEVEDCLIATDAAEKDAAVDFKVTVGSEPDVCSSATTISRAPGAPVYTCLVLENQGDVLFTRHDFGSKFNTAPLGIQFTEHFTLTPGSRISITHALAQSAGLTMAFGPFTGDDSDRLTYSWLPSRDGTGERTTAGIQIIRQNPDITATSTATATPTSTSTAVAAKTATSTPTATPTQASQQTPEAPELSEQLYLPLVADVGGKN